MKINTGSSIHQSEVQKTFELETSTKKDNKKSEQMVCPLIEDKENRYKLFKWEWKL